jgi:ElaB/YqjD/DUF883 family membrane-anchored ribosome-binding protein
MSDLVADAADLLVKIGHSETPEVRALTDKIQVSVNHMKEQLRSRARGLRVPERSATPWGENPWLYVVAAAIGIGAWMRFSRRRQHD